MSDACGLFALRHRGRGDAACATTTCGAAARGNESAKTTERETEIAVCPTCWSDGDAASCCCYYCARARGAVATVSGSVTCAGALCRDPPCPPCVPRRHRLKPQHSCSPCPLPHFSVERGSESDGARAVSGSAPDWMSACRYCHCWC